MSTVTRLKSLPTHVEMATRGVLFGALQAIIVLAIAAATLHLGWYGLGVDLNYLENT